MLNNFSCMGRFTHTPELKTTVNNNILNNSKSKKLPKEIILKSISIKNKLKKLVKNIFKKYLFIIPTPTILYIFF